MATYRVMTDNGTVFVDAVKHWEIGQNESLILHRDAQLDDVLFSSRCWKHVEKV